MSTNPTSVKLAELSATQPTTPAPVEVPQASVKPLTAFTPHDVYLPTDANAFRTSVQTALRKAGAEQVTMVNHEGIEVTKPRIEWVIEALMTRAEAGDMKAITEVLDRTVGKSHQIIEAAEGTEMILMLRGSSANPVSMMEL